MIEFKTGDGAFDDPEAIIVLGGVETVISASWFHNDGEYWDFSGTICCFGAQHSYDFGGVPSLKTLKDVISFYERQGFVFTKIDSDTLRDIHESIARLRVESTPNYSAHEAYYGM